MAGLLIAALLAAGLGAWAVTTARSPETISKVKAGEKTTPASPLGRRMVAVAEGLTPADGARAADVTKRLKALAADLDQPTAATEASELAAKLASWTAAGDMSPAAAAPVQAVLADVPGSVSPAPEDEAGTDPPPGTEDKAKNRPDA